MELNIVGMGPAGAVLALRAAHRGWEVNCFDPLLPSDHALHPWPATYGVFESEVPMWADEFFYNPIPLRCQIRPATPFQLGFSYRLLNAASLKEAVEALARQGRITLHSRAMSTSEGHGGALTIDCRGAVVTDAALWQVAVGYVLPFNEAIPSELKSPTFMDWSEAVGATPGHPPSFLYVQKVEDGWLIEETVLATSMSPGPVLELLRERLEKRLGVGAANAVREEVVTIPMGTVAPVEFDRNFGARAGYINPATGYSVGTALQAVDPFLDELEMESLNQRMKLSTRTQIWMRRADWALAHGLRRTGGKLIDQASFQSLQSFFDSFFQLPTEDQLAYLSGHSGVKVVRTMWRLRRFTGLTHPFLRPLFRRPLRHIWWGLKRY